MMEKLVPRNMATVWSAFKEASEMWKTRARSLHAARVVHIFGFFAIFEMATVWIIALGPQPDHEDPFSVLLFAPLGIVVIFSPLFISIFGLTMFAYSQLAIQYKLPGLWSFAPSALLLLAGHWIDTRFKFIEIFIRFYPSLYRDLIMNIIQFSYPVLQYFAIAITSLSGLIGAYVQFRITFGLVKHADLYRESKFYKGIAEPFEGVPTLRETLSTLLHKFITQPGNRPVDALEEANFSKQVASPNIAHTQKNKSSESHRKLAQERTRSRRQRRSTHRKQRARK